MKPIELWPWLYAPDELKALSPHGGDEDWVAVIPYRMAHDGFNDYLFDEGGRFGCCSVSTHHDVGSLPPGSVVKIGAHS